MKKTFLIIGLFLYILPCFSQKDLLPAFPNEISYQGVRAYFNGAPFTGVLVDEKTNVKWGVFKNGYKMGSFTEYYANGKKKSEGRFIDGVKEGEFTLYTEEGEYNKSITYKNNIVIKEILSSGQFINYYDDGIKRNEGAIINEKNQGLYIEYYDNEQFKLKGNYDNGEKNGIWKAWYINGDSKLEENYLNGKLDGKCTYRDENAQVNYMYYSNGVLTKEDKITNNLSQSNLGFYEYKGYFRNGKREGKGIQYYKRSGSSDDFEGYGDYYYEGDWMNDVWEGAGILCMYPEDFVKFTGLFKNGKRNGKGEIIARDTHSIPSKTIITIGKGEWVDGNIFGVFDWTWISPLWIKVYTGTMKNGAPYNGVLIGTLTNGRVLKSSFIDGKQHQEKKSKKK